jgi:hypothetical protein
VLLLGTKETLEEGRKKPLKWDTVGNPLSFITFFQKSEVL